jgi:hypothetical protein
VPDLCQRIADLAHLDDLGERKNNNLRAVNGSRGTDSVPGHHLHSTSFLTTGLDNDIASHPVHWPPIGSTQLAGADPALPIPSKPTEPIIPRSSD